MFSRGTRLSALMDYCRRHKIAMTYMNTNDRIFISITSSKSGRYSNQSGTNLNEVIDLVWTDIKRIRIW